MRSIVSCKLYSGGVGRSWFDYSIAHEPLLPVSVAMALSERQLFLSKRLVTESGVTDGGVLVDERGTIEKIVTREEADKIVTANDGKIKVTSYFTASIT